MTVRSVCKGGLLELLAAEKQLTFAYHLHLSLDSGFCSVLLSVVYCFSVTSGKVPSGTS